MRPLGVLAVAAVALLVLEIVVFVGVVKLIGLGWAVLLAVLTSLIGGWSLRREGMRGWRRFRSAVADGRPPGGEAADGVTGLAGALLLTVPGFVTDAVGLLLLVPPVRAAARGGVAALAQRRIPSALAGDLFGPRRVRVRRGPSVPTPPPPQQPGPGSGATPGSQPGVERGPGPPGALEGEIVDD
jgi:UPF0716 protein FxsA